MRFAPDGTYELPTLEQAAALATELGLRPDSRIVIVYAGLQVQQTARALLTFEQYGLGRRASVLNGGFDAWKAEGRRSPANASVRSGQRAADGGRAPRRGRGLRAGASEPACGDDCRRARDAVYKGEGGGQPRPGHIPAR